jgi:hypothetical protein
MQNQMIKDKIAEKAQGDSVMQKFIEDIFEIEIQNKNYKTPYMTYIEKCLKEMEVSQK